MKIKITAHHASFIEDFNNAMDSRPITPTTASDSAMTTRPSATPKPTGKTRAELDAGFAKFKAELADDIQAIKPGATPRTDAVAKTIGALAAEWKLGKIYATDFAICAQAEMNKLGTLETELAAANEKAERYRLCTLKQDAELAAAKCESITHKDLWGKVSDELSEAMLELAAARAECEKLTKDRAQCLSWLEAGSERMTADAAELARLRAEVERLKGWGEIHGETLGLIVSHIANERALLARAERAESAQLDAIARRDIAEAQLALKNSQCERAEQAAAGAQRDLAAKPCPNVVCSKEGTQYCALAESSVARLEAQLAAARKDSERLDWLEGNTVTLYCAGLYDGTNAAACIPNGKDHKGATIRDAIDAAMTNSKNT